MHEVLVTGCMNVLIAYKYMQIYSEVLLGWYSLQILLYLFGECSSHTFEDEGRCWSIISCAIGPTSTWMQL